MKKIILKCVIAVVVLGIIAYFLYRHTNQLTTAQYEYTSKRLPKAFSGYKICHITDLHNHSFGEDQADLVQAVRDGTPDVIVITGDLIDRHTQDMTPALTLIDHLTKIAPVYFVAGNHEKDNVRSLQLMENMQDVHILNNQSLLIEKDGEAFTLHGIFSPYYFLSEEEYAETLKELRAGSTTEFNVLLAHHPEYFTHYQEAGYDLILSGHAHGGQIRLPLIGAVIAPNQGLFPKYSRGVYEENGSTLILSAGLGTSRIPVRMMTPPEVLFITLH